MPEAGEPDFRDMSAETRQQIQLAQSLTGSAYYGGNDVEIFDGREKFEALERDIAGAREYINLQYYIFSDDSTGLRIAEALMERARAGVKVRVIYDHIGSIATKNSFFRSMREAGIEVYPFSGWLFRRLPPASTGAITASWW